MSHRHCIGIVRIKVTFLSYELVYQKRHVTVFKVGVGGNVVPAYSSTQAGLERLLRRCRQAKADLSLMISRSAVSADGGAAVTTGDGSQPPTYAHWSCCVPTHAVRPDTVMRMRISQAFAYAPHNHAFHFAKPCSLRISVSSSHGVRYQVGSVFSLPQRHADFRPPASSAASDQVLRISMQVLK